MKKSIVQWSLQFLFLEKCMSMVTQPQIVLINSTKESDDHQNETIFQTSKTTFREIFEEKWYSVCFFSHY